MGRRSEGFIEKLEKRLSRFTGVIANLSIPHVIYQPVCRLFCWSLGIRNFEPNYKLYPTLNSIFTRPDKIKADDGRKGVQLVSPVQGTVHLMGMVDSRQQFLGIKQSRFAIHSSDKIHNNTNIFYVGLYLSPSDNHNVLSAANWRINRRTHRVGFLSALKTLSCVTANEHVQYEGIWNHGYFSMTLIGALNVGSIKVYSDKQLKTNHYGKDDETKEMNVCLYKMQPFAHFSLGSYVLLVFEAPRTFELLLEKGQKLEKGHQIGKLCL